MRATREAVLAVALAAACGLLGAGSAIAKMSPPVAWEQWQHIPGVFDVAGPRSDGRLVVAAHTSLSLLSPSGLMTPYAPAYHAPDASESYIALSPGITPDGEACSFARDDVYALDLSQKTPGITRVSRNGDMVRVATITGVGTLSGITFDTVGTFGGRLLVLGPATASHTTLFAVDCGGSVATITTVATALEGGIAVAPRTFGAYGGQLIAANEVDGNVYAIAPSGALNRVVASGVPAGGDIGVESVGIVPAGGAAEAYMADRLTPGNPHPGTDSLLRLRGTALREVGLPGDVLVGTEGGATVVDVRCTASCVATAVATGPSVAHGEGKLLIVGLPSSTGVLPQQTVVSASVPAILWVTIAGGVAIVAASVLLLVRRARRRAASRV